MLFMHLFKKNVGKISLKRKKDKNKRTQKRFIHLSSFGALIIL